MNNIGKSSLDINYLDELSCGNSFLHRLDPRAKLIATLAFIITVISFDKYALWQLMPFFIYPVFLISLGGLPAGYLLNRVLLLLPFAVFIGIFNPIVDTKVFMQLGPIGVSAGWVSFLSIIMRFILTASAAFILISLTGFNAICNALAKLGLPRVFVQQLLFLYRYIFVLIDQVSGMIRAASFRSFKRDLMSLEISGPFLGNLLLRTFQRAERIYLAMCCRGFDGNMHVMRSMKFGIDGFIFLFLWLALFIFLRSFDLSLYLGNFIIKG
ncbi:MAG: cobalt ECF transporter T component CbiQ [Candidatus Omnitrophica bacterium]|nr:cobalt ECF transporter T component CbiQ [Candidatus Omnitrophota bacterium]